MNSTSISQPRGGGSEPPVLLGHVGVEALGEHVVALERRDLAGVAGDGGALGRHVELDRDHRRCRPIARPEQLRHPPRQQPGQVLVAVVLVAEPRRCLRPPGHGGAHEQRRVVGRVVVGVGQAHGDEHGRRCQCGERVGQRRRHVGRPSGVRRRRGTGGRRTRATTRSRPSDAVAARSSSRRRATTSSPALNPPAASQSVVGPGRPAGARRRR